MIGRTLRLPASIAAVALAACAIALLITSHKAEASFPGQNGKIVYVSRTYTEEAPYEIFTINPDGTGRRQLTRDSSANNFSPTYSPNGSRIAWEGYYDIWLMHADGSGKTRLTAGEQYEDYAPVFSPDGRRVFFVRVPRNGGQGAVYVKAISGGKPAERVKGLPDGAGIPVRSPDGKRIMFGYTRPGEDYSEIATARPDGSGLKVLTNYSGDVDAGGASWSPDSRRLVFSVFDYGLDKARIVTMAANGTGKRNILAPPHLFPSGPVFSPDGKKIVFAYESGHDIWTMNPDGTGLTNVTDTPSGTRKEIMPDWQPRPAASD